MASGDERARLGRQAALVLAGAGVFWIVVEWVGAAQGFSNRTLGLFNLIALAGFGVGLWLAFRAWQAPK